VSGQPVTQAHRSHFYQRALDGGLTVYQIVVRVFAINILLAGLATLTVLRPSPNLAIAALVAGGVFVGALLWTFTRSVARDAANGQT
jgi:hypothetical protein